MQWCILPFPCPKTPKMEGVMEKMIKFEDLVPFEFFKEKATAEEGRMVIDLRLELDIDPIFQGMIFEALVRG